MAVERIQIRLAVGRYKGLQVSNDPGGVGRLDVTEQLSAPADRIELKHPERSAQAIDVKPTAVYAPASDSFIAVQAVDLAWSASRHGEQDHLSGCILGQQEFPVRGNARPCEDSGARESLGRQRTRLPTGNILQINAASLPWRTARKDNPVSVGSKGVIALRLDAIPFQRACLSRPGREQHDLV